MLDPACGDGRFIAAHPHSVGVERDCQAAAVAKERSPSGRVHTSDFFDWAAATSERFDCAAGNPPFIRYQTFRGEVRARARTLCAELGAEFTGVTASWAPFLLVTASLLRPGGRMAFVVPAAIGHAPYAAPLLEFLIRSFATVQIVAVREKLFPQLSEDCWLLYADGRGGATEKIRFSVVDWFVLSSEPPRQAVSVPVVEWRRLWNRRLRPYLLSDNVRRLYQEIAARKSQQHIKPLHWYVACRLVLEGGFHPDEIKPRPPFRVATKGRRHLLEFDEASATGSEATILGGLKTKNVDIVVNKEGLGPVIAVSCKGMTGAFRNLTNRMEETVGECTNLHITYPALVLGYLFVIRANRASVADSGTGDQQLTRRPSPNNIAITDAGQPVESIVRFHAALCALTARQGIRDDVSRYEAVSMGLIDVRNDNVGQPLTFFPPPESPLILERFFDSL